MNYMIYNVKRTYLLAEKLVLSKVPYVSGTNLLGPRLKLIKQNFVKIYSGIYITDVLLSLFYYSTNAI